MGRLATTRRDYGEDVMMGDGALRLVEAVDETPEEAEVQDGLEDVLHRTFAARLRAWEDFDDSRGGAEGGLSKGRAAAAADTAYNEARKSFPKCKGLH